LASSLRWPLDEWLKSRSGALISQGLAVLVEEEGREGAHWLAVAGLASADTESLGA
jgi:hypothetical protein